MSKFVYNIDVTSDFTLMWAYRVSQVPFAKQLRLKICCFFSCESCITEIRFTRHHWQVSFRFVVSVKVQMYFETKLVFQLQRKSHFLLFQVLQMKVWLAVMRKIVFVSEWWKEINAMESSENPDQQQDQISTGENHRERNSIPLAVAWTERQAKN